MGRNLQKQKEEQWLDRVRNEVRVSQNAQRSKLEHNRATEMVKNKQTISKIKTEKQEMQNFNNEVKEARR